MGRHVTPITPMKNGNKNSEKRVCRGIHYTKNACVYVPLYWPLFQDNAPDCALQAPRDKHPHGLGYMGLAATAWVLMGAWVVLGYPYCHPMTTQTHPKGDRRVSEKVEKPMHASLKTAKSSPARAHMGGIDRGYPEFGPLPLLGVHIQEKVLQDPA